MNPISVANTMSGEIPKKVIDKWYIKYCKNIFCSLL